MPYGTVNADVIQSSVTGASLGAGNSSIMKNRIINGAMMVSQYNGTTSVTPTANAYFMDRWQAILAVASKFSVQQSSTAPTGFINSILATSTSAYTVGASEFFFIRQRIEGLNISDLAWGTADAKTVTVSFWVRSSLTGAFGGSVRNADASRTYPFSYTISVANTWEQKTVTIAGDTSGTWLTTNGVGIELDFTLGAGSTYLGTANTWSANNYLAPTGATSVVGTNGATFYITGVQLEVGSSATGFEYRQYQQELALCQRYYYRTSADDQFTGLCVGVIDGATTLGSAVTSLPVTMRAQPTVNFSTLRIYDGSATPAVTSIASNRSSKTQLTNTFSATGGGLTVGRAGVLQANNSTSAYIDATAEL